MIVPGGLITSPRGGPGGPGMGFCSPGGGFSGSRRSGKPLRLLRLKKPPPGLRTTPVLVIRAPVRLLRVLE